MRQGNNARGLGAFGNNVDGFDDTTISQSDYAAPDPDETIFAPLPDEIARRRQAKYRSNPDAYRWR